MTTTPVFPPTISDLLEQFFAGYQPKASEALRTRISIVRRQLEHTLEVEGLRVLTTPQLAIVESERQLDPEHAFARTMRADDLYYALPLCLDAEHALDSLLEREAQLDVIAALAESLWRRRLISDRTVSECAMIEFDIAVKRGRDFVKAARGAKWIGER